MPDNDWLARCVERWTPAVEERSDFLAAEPLAALASLLEADDVNPKDGGVVPPLWHWVFFQRAPQLAELGPDGHPSEGAFYPPIPRRRRMFAGGRVRMQRPLKVGSPAHRRTELRQVAVKQGRTGEMLFVTLRREFRQNQELCLVEEEDLMYRSGEPAATAARPAGAQAQDRASAERSMPASSAAWQRSMSAEPVKLFVYSALTANAHRIHYDLAYAQGVEGYPGLVVHGPLLVLSMLELARRNAPSLELQQADYRLQRPVYTGERVRIEGNPTVEKGAELSVVKDTMECAASATLIAY